MNTCLATPTVPRVVPASRSVPTAVGHLSPMAALALALVACGSEPTSPADLEAAESAAEGAFDSALSADFAGARVQAEEVAAAWAKYKPQAETDRAPAQAIVALDAAVGALPATLAGTPNVVDAARSINAVSAPMSQLYALYSPAVPVTVLDLDYLGREVLLDALASDTAGATTHLNEIDAAWGGLRPKVLQAGGTAEAADFDATLARARAANASSNVTELEAAAKAELDAVDTLEAVFAAQADAPD